MNRVLEDDASIARGFPDDQQETLGRQLLRAAEELRIDARLAEAEARGGENDLNDVCDRVIARLRDRAASQE